VIKQKQYHLLVTAGASSVKREDAVEDTVGRLTSLHSEQRSFNIT
jgi:molybdopterin biosynthesis enzyme